ncbi:uncharacterized protein LOC141691152 [Apium graveolens]|uniref:uncharacterized protein LOC141691152 n=1 Tax=Apium graveolens TaxID=4045 RepID=UPI003D796359
MASDSTQTNQVQTNQDPSSIYYIHPSDSCTNQLVSVKFNGEGFNNWKRSMMLTLSAKNKLGFVNDTITRSVLFLKTARAIWRDLEERFGYASMPQISSLEQKLVDLHQEQLSVSEFYTKLKTIWDSLDDAYPLPTCTCEKCSCNLTGRIQKIQQEQRVLQFLMKLNDNFSAVRGNILMMTPMLNVTHAYRLVAQEENHKEMSQQVTQTDTLAFVADKRRFSNNYYGAKFPQQYSNQQQYSAPSQQFQTQFIRKPRSSYYCTNCKINGHSIERCFKIHGFPPGFKPRERKVAAFSQNSQNV